MLCRASDWPWMVDVFLCGKCRQMKEILMENYFAVQGIMVTFSEVLARKRMVDGEHTN